MAKNSTNGSFDKLYNDISKSVEKTITKALLDGTEQANNNTTINVNPKKIKAPSIDISEFISLDNSDLEGRIYDLFDESIDKASTKIEKKLITAMQLAQRRGIKIEEPGGQDFIERNLEVFGKLYPKYIEKSQEVIQDYYNSINEAGEKANQKTQKQLAETEKQIKKQKKANEMAQKAKKVVEKDREATQQSKAKTSEQKTTKTTDKSLPTQIDKISQAEIEMGNEGESASKKIKDGLDKSAESAKKYADSLEEATNVSSQSNNKTQKNIEETAEKQSKLNKLVSAFLDLEYRKGTVEPKPNHTVDEQIHNIEEMQNNLRYKASALGVNLDLQISQDSLDEVQDKIKRHERIRKTEIPVKISDESKDSTQETKSLLSKKEVVQQLRTELNLTKQAAEELFSKQGFEKIGNKYQIEQSAVDTIIAEANAKKKSAEASNELREAEKRRKDETKEVEIETSTDNRVEQLKEEKQQIESTTQASKEKREAIETETKAKLEDVNATEKLNRAEEELQRHHSIRTGYDYTENPDGSITDRARQYTYEDDYGRRVTRTQTTQIVDGEEFTSVAVREQVNYQRVIDRTKKAWIELVKAQHRYDEESGKPQIQQNAQALQLLSDSLESARNEFREAGAAAHTFIRETADFYNETAPEGSKFTFQNYANDVREAVRTSMEKENLRHATYYSDQVVKKQSKLRSIDNTLEFEINNGKHTTQFIADLQNIRDIINRINNTPLDAVTQNEINEIDYVVDEYNKLQKEKRLSANIEANENSVAKGLAKINSILSDNTRLGFRTSDVAQDLRVLQQEFKNFDTSKPQEELNQLNTRLLKVMADFEALPKTMKGENIFQKINSQVRIKVSQLAAQYLSFQDLIRYARSAVTTIIDLDTQLVDLRKTTAMTSTELEQFYNDSSNVAKQLGVTTSEIISQASAWSRLGYNTKEASTEMAKLSSVFASISPGMDTSSSTDYLVSTMQAFGIAVDDVQRKIMDNVNAIGNTMATSNSEIGEMLERSSAAMKAANNTIEETIALESAAVEITRNAERTGTAFRTIAMRIRGYDEETEDFSEDLANIAGDIADLTKIGGKGGITIFADKDKTEFKSTYQILKEISQIWDELTDKQQAQLLEKLGGKRGAQSIAGLLDDFSSVEEALQTMENAAGSSEKEMDIIRDSLEFKINSLRETWVGILQEFANRGAIGDFIDMLTSLSEGVDKVTSSFGFLQTALVGLGTIWGTRNLGLFSIKNGKLSIGTEGMMGMFSTHQKDASREMLQSLQGKLNDLKNQSGGNASLRSIQNDLLNIADNAEEAGTNMQQWGKDLANSNMTVDQGLSRIDNQLNNIKTSTSGISTFFKNIGANIANMLVSLAISTAISLAVEGIQRLANSYDDLMEKVRVYTQEYVDNNKQITDYSERIEELRETMESSSSTEQEVTEATKELYNIQNDLISTYDNYANGIDLVNGKLETQLDLLQNINKQNLRDTINKIENERSAKESALNLFRNVFTADVGEPGGVILPFSPAQALTVGLAKSIDAAFDKNKTIKDTLFGSQDGIDLYSNIKQIRKEVEQYSKTISGIKVDKTTLNFIHGLKTFNYDQYGNVQISGQVEDVKQDIYTLQNLLSEAGIENEKLNNQLSEYAYDTTKVIEQNIEAYNDILLSALINGDNVDLIAINQRDTAKGYYEELTQLYEKYQEAVLSGNDELTRDYSATYAKTFDEIRNQIINNDGIDNAYIDYFKKLYPELQNVINNWDIKKDIDKQLESDIDLSQYLKNTSFEDIKSDYFRVINNLDTVSENEARRFEQLSGLAAEHEKDVVHLVEAYKTLDDEINSTASALESLSVIAPSFATITTALSEQSTQGYITKETLEALNSEYSELFQSFNYKTNRFEKFEDSINKELERLQKGGNVNLKLRPEINTKELKDKLWDDISDGIATVYSSTFSNKEGTKWVNFTPIIVDPETGEYKGVLTPDELQSYAEGVINGTRLDDKNLQIGTAFDTLEEADKAAEKIHTLHEELHNLNGNTFLELKNNLYEFTENGVKLNSEALSQYNDILGEVALTSARLKEANAVQKYQKEATYLRELIGDNNQLKKAYENGTDALKQYIHSNENLSQSLVEDIDASMQQLSVLAEEINKYDMLEAQIRATTSTLNEYNQATETANLKDNFDTANSMVASLKEAMEKGWTGTDEFKKGMEYIGGYNFDTSIMEYGDNYDSTWAKQFEEKIARAERYFTEDISGIYNFLDDAIERTEHQMVDFVDDAYVINIDNVDEFAQKMDMSVSEAMDLLLATEEAWDFNLDFSSVEDSIVDGLHAIDEESVTARTDFEKFAESIDKLKYQGYDTSELERVLNEVASDVAPDIAIADDIANISSKSKDTIHRWANNIVKEAEGEVSGVKIDFDADVEGLSTTIDELKEVQSNARIKGKFDETEYKHATVVLQALLDKKHELESETIMNVDTSGMTENQAGIISTLQSYVTAYQELENAKTIGVDDSQLQVAEQRVENIKTQIENIATDSAYQLSGVGIDTSKISVDADPTQLYETITNIDVNKGEKKEVKIDADDSSAQKTLSNLTTTINNTHAEVKIEGKLVDDFGEKLQDKIKNSQTYTVDVEIKKIEGFEPQGGDNKKKKSGKPYAQGGRITHASTNNLVGELGQELVVHNGRYYTVGDNGAEIVPLSKGDIVFNAEQTAQLLRNGRINSRGKIVGDSFVNGNAYDNRSKVHGEGTDDKAGTKTWNESKEAEQAADKTKKAADKTKKAAKNLTDVTKDTAEVFDWIAIKLQRLEEAIQSLDKVATNIYKKWDTRTEYLNKEIAKTTEELKAQIKAQERYQKVWADGSLEYAKGKGKKGVKISNKPKKKDYKSGTDSDGKTQYNTAQYKYDLKQYKEAQKLWKKKAKDKNGNVLKDENGKTIGYYQNLIQQGKIGGKDIEKIKNKYLVEAIKEYQELWEKGIQAQQAAEDLRIKLSDLNKQKFENIITYWDELIDKEQKSIDLIDTYIERSETLSYFVDLGNYKNQIKLFEKQVVDYNSQLTEAMAHFNEMVKLGKSGDGGFDVNSQEYWDEYSKIADILIKLSQTQNKIEEYYVKIKKEQWERFDYLQERIQRIVKESEYLQKLLSSEKLMDDFGNLNNRGYAYESMIGVQYNEAIRYMQAYQKEREEFEAVMDKNSQDDIAHWEELTDHIYEGADAFVAAKESAKSFYEELINTHLNKLKELMDEYKKTLSAAKDLYDYQKNVGNQTDNITKLRKQLLAYQGDDSEAGRKRRQELTNQLNAAEQQLQETEWDRYINQTGDMLEKLYEDYEEIFNARLDNIDGLMQILVREINDNPQKVVNGINELKTSYGATVDNFNNLSVDIVSGFNNGTLSNTTTSIFKSVNEIAEATKKMWTEDTSGTTYELEIGADGTLKLKKKSGAKTPEQKLQDELDADTAKKKEEAQTRPMAGVNAGMKSLIPGVADQDVIIFDEKLTQEADRIYADLLKKKQEYDRLYTQWLNEKDVQKKQKLAIQKDTLSVEIENLKKKLDEMNYGKNLTNFSYAKGSKSIPSNRWAWTQENGEELIFRRSDGAMLTPLGQGSMVFTNEMSKRLWEIASGNVPSILGDTKLPNINSNIHSNLTQNNTISISLPNVQDYESFKTALQNDTRFEKFVQEITIGQAMGNNTLNKRKY